MYPAQTDTRTRTRTCAACCRAAREEGLEGRGGGEERWRGEWGVRGVEGVPVWNPSLYLSAYISSYVYVWHVWEQ
jgi:hypothetical protein